MNAFSYGGMGGLFIGLSAMNAGNVELDLKTVYQHSRLHECFIYWNKCNE